LHFPLTLDSSEALSGQPQWNPTSREKRARYGAPVLGQGNRGTSITSLIARSIRFPAPSQGIVWASMWVLCQAERRPLRPIAWRIMSTLDGRVRRCRCRKDPFIFLALVKTTQRLLSRCFSAWARPFRTGSSLDRFGFAFTFRPARFVILNDPEHERAFLNNLDSSPEFGIADSLLHHAFKNLEVSRHPMSVAERR
jgi:hypothetical protein